jgi:hypothetical protein
LLKFVKRFIIPDTSGFTNLLHLYYTNYYQVTRKYKKYPGKYLLGIKGINKPIFVVSSKKPDNTLPTEESEKSMTFQCE